MVQYGTTKSWPWWADNLSRWNHLMLVVNSSINILIYTAKVCHIGIMSLFLCLKYSVQFSLIILDFTSLSGFQVPPSSFSDVLLRTRRPSKNTQALLYWVFIYWQIKKFSFCEYKIPNNSQYYKQEKNYSFKTW